MSFNLPPEITYTQNKLSETDWSFVFRHQNLGELGRILVKGISGQTRISCEVVGDPGDPMTAKRKAIFEPLAKQITDLMNQQTGGSGTPMTPSPSGPGEPKQKIASKVLQCNHCGEPVAMIIFSDDGHTVGRLEDYARMMHSQVKTMNLPTWVVGPPIGEGDFSDLPADTEDMVRPDICATITSFRIGLNWIGCKRGIVGKDIDTRRSAVIRAISCHFDEIAKETSYSKRDGGENYLYKIPL